MQGKKKGENVLISCHGTAPMPLVKSIIKEVYSAGGTPFFDMTLSDVERELLMGMTKEQLKLMAELECEKMRHMSAYIGIRGDENMSELSDVPSEKINMYSKYFVGPVNEIRVPKTKWVVLRYPCASIAQSASMSMEAFEDFYFDVCNLDYGKMDRAMDTLKELMEKTDNVHIVAKDTDISFSIKGIPAVKCAGECNIPDGEVYTAPVRESVNGTITYNTKSDYNSFTFENVSLTFKEGRIINASSNDSKRINEIFDTDEGARYVGEFALGVNPYIKKPMNNILFDEKIMGSIHFTPGCCYDDAPNGNKSAVHWDLVLIQTHEYGGGEIYFDNVLIRKDGRFLNELEVLNPENLI
jgi:aminopeptidase